LKTKCEGKNQSESMWNGFSTPPIFSKKNCIFKKFYILIIEVINIAQMRILMFDYKVNKIGEIK
jgi:hypothetical protein